MIKRTFSILFSFIFVLLLLLSRSSQPSHAAAADVWWDEGWPYRIPVTVSGSGVAQATINFTTAFANLGLNGALLDVRSLRVVPYTGNNPAAGGAIPYEERYSTMLENADTPQIGWHASGVYWRVNDGVAVADNGRYSQGTGSLKATVTNTAGGYGYPGVEMLIAAGQKDWRNYETFIYDVWPEVNASAIDQSPDLYSFKLYNTTGCSSSTITQGGPALALDQWNHATVSLKAVPHLHHTQLQRHQPP